jgi:hypothetical protein
MLPGDLSSVIVLQQTAAAMVAAGTMPPQAGVIGTCVAVWRCGDSVQALSPVSAGSMVPCALLPVYTLQLLSLVASRHRQSARLAGGCTCVQLAGVVCLAVQAAVLALLTEQLYVSCSGSCDKAEVVCPGQCSHTQQCVNRACCRSAGQATAGQGVGVCLKQGVRVVLWGLGRRGGGL